MPNKRLLLSRKPSREHCVLVSGLAAQQNRETLGRGQYGRTLGRELLGTDLAGIASLTDVAGVER